MKPLSNPQTATVQSVAGPSNRRRLAISDSPMLPNAVRRPLRKRRPVVLLVKTALGEPTEFEPIIQVRSESPVES